MSRLADSARQVENVGKPLDFLIPVAANITALDLREILPLFF